MSLVLPPRRSSALGVIKLLWLRTGGGRGQEPSELLLPAGPPAKPVLRRLEEGDRFPKESANRKGQLDLFQTIFTSV